MRRDSVNETLSSLYEDFAEYQEPDTIKLPISEFDFLLEELGYLRTVVEKQDTAIEEWHNLVKSKDKVIAGYQEIIKNYEEALKRHCSQS